MRGTATGLMDSNDRSICVGDYVRVPTDVNHEFHGDWAVYEVVLRGLVPILSYRYSEKGELLPKGYVARELSELYDRKLFLHANDLSNLTPVEECVSFPAPGHE